MWATEPHADLPVKMGASGPAAKAPSTVFKVFRKTVEEHGEEPALKFKDTSAVGGPSLMHSFVYVYVCWGCRLTNNFRVLHNAACMQYVVVLAGEGVWGETMALRKQVYDVRPRACAPLLPMLAGWLVG